MSTPRHSRILTRSIATLFAISSVASAADWTGGTSTDWNNGLNWSGGIVPTDNAVINTITPNFTTITTDITATPVDIIVGDGGGTNGRLDHITGTAQTGTQNWMYVGIHGGTGFYNLANTSGTGGTLTGFGLGSGSMVVGNGGPSGRLYIGGSNAGSAGGNGTVNVNTSGTLTIRNDLKIGNSGGTGLMNVDAGTITTGGWNFIGGNENGTGGNGTLRMSGGTLTNTGRTYVGQGGVTGKLELTGNATYSDVNNELFIIGEGTGSNGTVNVSSAGALLNSVGEIQLGQGAGGFGTMNVSAGTVQGGGWMAIGREGATGILNLSGTGIFKKTGGNDTQIIIGSLGGNGTVNQTGGQMFTQGGSSILLGENSNTGTWNASAGTGSAEQLRIGAIGAGNGVVNLSGTAQLTFNEVNVSQENGTGTLTITGGTLINDHLQVGVGNGKSGKGIINQSAGTVTTATWVAVGLGSSQQAEYNISGGTVTAAGFEAGADTAGKVALSGTGTINVTNNFEVPTRNGAGTFNISGGTLNTVGFQQGGRDGNTLGSGVTNQTGGNVNVSGDLDVQRTGVGTGTYNLSGGTLSVNGAIDLNGGTFAFTGGKITRSNTGTIVLNGNLTTGAIAAALGIGTGKNFDVNGTFNISSGVTFDVPGIVIPASPGGVLATGSFTLGSDDAIIGTFGPGLTLFTNLTNSAGATFISEAAGEGHLFNPGVDRVYWVQESAGTVTLQYSVPEPATFGLLSLAGLALAGRRRRK